MILGLTSVLEKKKRWWVTLEQIAGIFLVVTVQRISQLVVTLILLSKSTAVNSKLNFLKKSPITNSKGNEILLILNKGSQHK